MKIITTLILVLFIFSSCRQEDEEKLSFYSEEQEEIMEDIIGEWNAKYIDRKICFLNHVEFDVFPNWINTDYVVFQAQGDCTFISWGDTTDYFFEISKEGNSLRLMPKADSSYCVTYEYFGVINGELWMKYELDDRNFQIFEK